MRISERRGLRALSRRSGQEAFRAGGKRTFFALLLTAISLFPPTAALQAQSLPEPVILVINMQRILEESLAVRDIQRQIEERRGAYQQELRQREDQLRAADQQIARQRASLSGQEYALKRRELEEQLAQFQRELAAQRKLLDDAFAKGMRTVERQVLSIADQIAAERGANLVLPKTAVVLVHADFEITEEALRRLNDNMPDYDMAASPEK